MLKIGSISLSHPYIMAPIAGYTDSPFRRVVKNYGAGLVYTELISADALVHNNQKTLLLLKHFPEEKPIVMQLLGNKIDTLIKASMIAISYGADIIDLNVGCPARNVVNNGSGSALLKKPESLREILIEMRKAIPIPFTMKTRTGWDDSSKNILQIVDMANECGLNAIAIHLRTRAQGFKKGIDMQSLIDAVKISRIPVIGNGDILTPEDARHMMETSGCAGIMIGRGAIGNPWIFQLIIDYIEKGSYTVPSLSIVKEIMISHVSMMSEFYGETKGVKLFRKHLVHYSKGSRISPLLSAKHSSDFRAKAMTIEKLEPLINLITEYLDHLMKVANV
ncbi:MAG: tRNA dihydrouridine synthase DusB [bacterium]